METLEARIAKLSRAAVPAQEIASIAASAQSHGAPTRPEPKPETLAVITAAATAFLGKAARIRSARPCRPLQRTSAHGRSRAASSCRPRTICAAANEQRRKTRREETELKLQITIDGRAYAVDVELMEDEESLSPASFPPFPLPPQTLASTDTKLDPNACRSPVNGVVFKVNVQPGQAVEAGEVVLILEAMKMETHIAAPRRATVNAVHVKPGDPVKINQRLVEFE